MRLNLYVARPYQHNGEERTDWIRVGVAFPLKNRAGFNIQLHANPLDGKLVAFENTPTDTDSPPAE